MRLLKGISPHSSTSSLVVGVVGSKQELAIVYAALILEDEGVSITTEKVNKLLQVFFGLFVNGFHLVSDNLLCFFNIYSLGFQSSTIGLIWSFQACGGCCSIICCTPKTASHSAVAFFCDSKYPRK